MGWLKRLKVWRNSKNGWPKISQHSRICRSQDQDKVALRWNLKATHEKDFADFPATHKKFETQGVEILRFEGDKIKEAWTMGNLADLVQ